MTVVGRKMKNREESMQMQQIDSVEAVVVAVTVGGVLDLVLHDTALFLRCVASLVPNLFIH